jgi:hypothetical protein
MKYKLLIFFMLVLVGFSQGKRRTLELEDGVTKITLDSYYMYVYRAEDVEGGRSPYMATFPFKSLDPPIINNFGVTLKAYGKDIIFITKVEYNKIARFIK